MITRKTLYSVWITLLSCFIPMLNGQSGSLAGFLDNFSTVGGALNAFHPAPAASNPLEWPTSNAFTLDQTGTGQAGQARRNSDTSVILEQQHTDHGHVHAGDPGHHSQHEHVGNPVGISQFVAVETPSSPTPPTREELLEIRRRQEWDLRNGVGTDAFVSDPRPVEVSNQHNPTGDPMALDQGLPTRVSQFFGPGSAPQSEPPQTDPSSNQGLDPSNPNLTREERRELRRQQRRNRRNRNRNNLDQSSATATEGDPPMTRRERRRQERLQQRWDRQEQRRLERLGLGSRGPADAHAHTSGQSEATLDQRPWRRNRNRRRHWNRNRNDIGPNTDTTSPVVQPIEVTQGIGTANNGASSFISAEEQNLLSAQALEWLQREKDRLLAVEKAKLAEENAKKLAAKLAAEKAAEEARLLAEQKAKEDARLKAEAVRKAKEEEALRQKQEQERLLAEMRSKVIAAEKAAEEARLLEMQRAKEAAVREAEIQRIAREKEVERQRLQRLEQERARQEAEQRARELAKERARLAELERLRTMTTTTTPAPVVVHRRRRRRRRLFRGIKRLFGKK